MEVVALRAPPAMEMRRRPSPFGGPLTIRPSRRTAPTETSRVVSGPGQKGATPFDKLGGDDYVWRFSERTLLGLGVLCPALPFLVFFELSLPSPRVFMSGPARGWGLFALNLPQVTGTVPPAPARHRQASKPHCGLLLLPLYMPCK